MDVSIVCFQETKMELIYSSTVLETLGSEFDDYVYLPAIGTRGGILLAWKSRAVSITDPMFTTNSITAKVSTAAGTPWWLSVVYGPQDDADKIAFLQELRDVRAACTGPWLLCGDFNLIYQDEDKNNGNLNRRMMGRFRRLLNDLVLKEIYLSGRRFTWSNERSPPTLSHIDRFLCTTDWEDLHGECHLRCLASVVSDHSPLLLDCNPSPATHRRFRFEEFWLRMDGFQDTVAGAWASVTDDDPFRRLVLRLQATARRLTSWSARSVGNIRDKMAVSRELILRFDKAQEDRLLMPHEDWLRKQLKVTYLGLASFERTIARQRARIAFLKDGDANTSFFHRQCTFRRQKNRIHSLMSSGRVVTDHADMAEAAFDHFDALLGTAVDRDCTLDLTPLIEPATNLHELDAPFTADEIWGAVKRLPGHKAPGPDGFTAEFLRSCWAVVGPDIVATFQQLHDMRGRGFCCLNQALVSCCLSVLTPAPLAITAP
jgi:exonuclease III